MRFWRRKLLVGAALGSLLSASSIAAEEETIDKEALVAETVVAAATAATTATTWRSCNEELAIQVAPDGRFNMGVGTDTQCNPEGNFWDLMYRWPNAPGTSFSTVRIEGVDHRLGIDVQPVSVTEFDDAVFHEYLIGDLRVIQEISFDRIFSEGEVPNTANIEYDVENLGTSEVAVELRVMIDTELNYNDGAPFQLPGAGAVTNERQFFAPSIPEFYLAFEDFADEEHISAGLLRRPEEIEPYRVIFGRWPGLWSTPFDYTPDPAATILFDSALAVYFRAPDDSVEPGQRVVFNTRYGRADITGDLSPPLSLLVVAPTTTVQGNQFTVTAFITNISMVPAEEAFARIDIPEEFTSVGPRFQELPDPFEIGETAQVDWTINVDPTAEPRSYGFTVTTSARFFLQKFVTRFINVEPSGGRPIGGAPPLLGAHGITGQASDMEAALLLALDLIPDLASRDTLSSNTGAITSVWTNGATIAEDAARLVADTGAPGVNVIAHSKGGLDSRVALWENPDLFQGLGMLATPNGGSGLADTLCVLRRLPGGGRIQGGFGPCDDEYDGLYNLQTGWMRDVFNATVRDHIRHDLWIAAGDCIGFAGSAEGRISCNATGLLGASCTDTDGDGDVDGENAVCVWSAFARSAVTTRDGKHHPIRPIFLGLDHTDMRTKPCPISAVLAKLYPRHSEGNPWLDQGGDGCEDLLTAAGPATAAGASLEPALEELSDFSPQTVQAVDLGPTGSADVPVDSESASALYVWLMAESSDLTDFLVTAPDGNEIEPLGVVETEVFFAPAVFVEYPETAAGSVLSLTGSPETVVGLVTGVTGPVTAALNATAGPDASVEIEVVVRGASPSDKDDFQVEAALGNAGEQFVVALSLAEVSGSELVFRTTATAPAGGYVPIDVRVSGPVSRVLSGGVALPDGSGSIDALAYDQLVDTDGDGAMDALALGVAVTASVPDAYQISLDLEAAGQVAASANGSADLDAGHGTIEVLVDFLELAAAGVAGPYDVTDVILTRGTGTRVRVDDVELLGMTGPVRDEDIDPGVMALSRPIAAAFDDDNNGFLDRLNWRLTAWIQEPGSYALTGSLIDPEGAAIAAVDTSVELAEGPNSIAVDFAGELIGAGRSGVYALAGLRAVLETDPTELADAPTGSTELLDASEWIGGTPSAATLIRLWIEEEAAGEIPNHGLFTSELNRLQRVALAIQSNETATAVSELERFADHLSRWAGARITPAAAERLSGYATGLRNALLS